MAIRLSDFKQTKYLGLYKSIKEDTTKGYKYFARFRIDDKIYKKVLGHSKKDKLTDRSANILLTKYKEDIENGHNPKEVTKLDKVMTIYFDTLTNTQWTKNKQAIYNRYIKAALGNKSINKIKKMDIDKIISNLSKRGLKPRTQKTVLEVLKPFFNFAVENKIITNNLASNITIKVPNQKKVVTNATELFKKIYIGINEYYKDNPYYKALFLFGFTGRRKTEILNLRWENIDFNHGYYWIKNTKNNDNQKYQLPVYLVEVLKEIPSDHRGLVFKSPVTGKKVINIDRQMKNLKKFIGVENLTMHYMRNVLVSMLAEQRVESITLSGILGHKDPNTINKYLSLNHYKSSQIGLEKIIDLID